MPICVDYRGLCSTTSPMHGPAHSSIHFDTLSILYKTTLIALCVVLYFEFWLTRSATLCSILSESRQAICQRSGTTCPRRPQFIGMLERTEICASTMRLPCTKMKTAANGSTVIAIASFVFAEESTVARPANPVSESTYHLDALFKIEYTNILGRRKQEESEA